MVAAALVALGAVVWAMSLDGGVASPARHLLLVPVAGLAASRGSVVGALIGVMAGLLQAPLLLPAIEQDGLGPRALDGLVSMALPVGLGAGLGRAVDRGRGPALRLRAMLAIERRLGGGHELGSPQLEAVAEEVRRALGASAIGIVLTGPEAPVVASAPRGAVLSAASAALRVVDSGAGLEFVDATSDPRLGPPIDDAAAPTRGLVLPLHAARQVTGALAVEWRGDAPPGGRTAARELAVHLALVLENARLGALQRRSTQELEDKVAAATRRLRELDRAKTEFISVVSHELRTPITAVQGFAELLLARAMSPDRARRCLGHMLDEAQRLARIVTDLLDLSRIEAGGGLALCREQVDLRALAARNVEVFAAAHPGHRFSARPTTGGPLPVAGDPDALDRVLKNLLSNAVKYSPRGGEVRVVTRFIPGPPAMVEIAVEDEGVGIPAEALPRIFEKYVRVPDPATASVRGLGLGLSLVRALVEAHGGRVSVDSRPGSGSRFSVALPA